MESSRPEHVSFDEAYARYPEEFGPQGGGMPPGLSQVYLATPPEQYAVFVAREVGTLRSSASSSPVRVVDHWGTTAGRLKLDDVQHVACVRLLNSNYAKY